MAVALDHLGEVDVDLVGERGDPREHVGELVLDVGPGAFADRLGELAELLGQPGDGGGDPTIPVDVTVGALDHVLELAQVHDRTVPQAASPSRGVRGLGTISYMASIHDLEMPDIDGDPVSFDAFRGQVLLIVNVASA